MTGVQARMLSGNRLHLQHGPIDLVIGADGDRARAFAAARNRFDTILTELVTELDCLRRPMHPNTPAPLGAVANRMHDASLPFSEAFVTRMAAVAGAVADEVLQAMTDATALRRAYVNNGGDIALHLTKGERFTMAMAGLDGRDLGRIEISHSDGIDGIATSGQGGRSLSFGIAESVSILAKNAATADVAATLVANALNLPNHPAIHRTPAHDLHDDTDLGDRPVVTRCDPLSATDIETALTNGTCTARAMLDQKQIHAAALFLQGQSRTLGHQFTPQHRTIAHA
ncbi:UPF0280 family protein [Profundibacter amoris]|uniref:UPF0280 family protein n=1 Tax=Profundibacter amoris TaxID=2171755 RepID=A0A347UKU6_9RHOB|nr:UPF0280 family protein [Profundibacter amoris]AXX99474.1 UPF0280 family protein [Profundibacter amoris]